MSLEYPLIIENERELCRLIRDIAREVLANNPKEKPFMKRSDLNELLGERMATKLINSGKIKIRFIEGSRLILRKDYENWINKVALDRRYPITEVQRKKVNP